MPGPVFEYVQAQEQRRFEQAEARDELEARFRPTPNYETGSRPDYERGPDAGDLVADRVAANRLRQYERQNPGKDYVQLLEQHDREQSRREVGRGGTSPMADQDVAVTTPQQQLSPEEQRRVPAAQLSTQQIESQTRELHAEFKTLASEYQTAGPAERQELKQAMQPIVARENELRAEYGTRVQPEMTQDRVPDRSQGISY